MIIAGCALVGKGSVPSPGCRGLADVAVLGVCDSVERISLAPPLSPSQHNRVRDLSSEVLGHGTEDCW